MLRNELLSILVCPETRQPLTLADDKLLARLNRAIARGALLNKAGQPVKQPFSGGLVRDDEVVVYGVVDDIPMLLIDEAVPLDQPAIEAD